MANGSHRCWKCGPLCFCKTTTVEPSIKATGDKVIGKTENIEDKVIEKNDGKIIEKDGDKPIEKDEKIGDKDIKKKPTHHGYGRIYPGKGKKGINGHLSTKILFI